MFFSGSMSLRKHSLRLLYLIVFNPFWLKVKVSKTQVNYKDKRAVSFLIPDFCQDSFIMLVPYQLQMVKQPLRHDLSLSEEHKSYIFARNSADSNSDSVVNTLR